MCVCFFIIHVSLSDEKKEKGACAVWGQLLNVIAIML